MSTQFEIAQNINQSFPGLHFESFEIHLRGEVSKIKPGDRLYPVRNPRLRLVVQAIEILPDEGPIIDTRKQRAVLKVVFISNDRNAYFPPSLLVVREILELESNPYEKS